MSMIIRNNSLRRRMISAALLAIGILAAGGAFASHQYSFDARFKRSKPALDAYATRATSLDARTPLPPLPQRLGAFKPHGVERLPNGFLFFCDYGHPLDANGLAYSLTPLPRELGHDYFKPIEGNWVHGEQELIAPGAAKRGSHGSRHAIRP